MLKIKQYRWNAKDKFDRKQKGICLAEDKESIEMDLLRKGYSNINIKRNLSFYFKPNKKDITQFIAYLSLLINKNITLMQALKLILNNTKNLYLFSWINSIIVQLELGYSLSKSLAYHHKYIQDQEIQLIKIGEDSGNLGAILDRIAKARMKSELLSKKINKILFYPIIILIISLGLSMLLLIFIIPQFQELYQSKDKMLPFITQLLFDISSLLRTDFDTLLIYSLIILLLMIFLEKKVKILTLLKFVFLSKTPILREIISHSRVVFFCQNMALLLSAKIRIDKALDCLLSSQYQDPILKKEINIIINILQQGYNFSESLNSNVFNEEIIAIITIGEKSGNLAQMLSYISEMYQHKLDYQIDILSQLLEPILMLVIGAIIGTIIIGLYLPIFDLGGMIQ